MVKYEHLPIYKKAFDLTLHYRRKYQGCLVFFQVGCLIGIFGSHAEIAHNIFIPEIQMN